MSEEYKTAGGVYLRDGTNDLYLLANLSKWQYALVSLSGSGSSWTGVAEIGPAPRGVDEDGWEELTGGSEFTFVFQMPKVCWLELQEHWKEPAMRLMNANKKVAAIKLVRNETGKTLREAKDWCEDNWRVHDMNPEREI